MRVLPFILALLFMGVTVQAQNVISINASAEVAVPADRIAFRININAEAETPQKAYDLHKQREKILVQQLKKFNIKEKEITFEPVSINRINQSRYNGSGKELVRTQQSVILSLRDFSIYEKIQLTLIEHNFDEFSGNFESTKSEQGEEEALRKALKLARKKAGIIADETGLRISGIRDINYSYNRRPPQPMREMASVTSSDRLLEYDQMVNISASVSVTYNFK